MICVVGCCGLIVCFVAWMVVLVSGLLRLLVVLIVLLCVVFFGVKYLVLCVLGYCGGDCYL